MFCLWHLSQELFKRLTCFREFIAQYQLWFDWAVLALHISRHILHVAVHADLQRGCICNKAPFHICFLITALT